MLPATSLNQYLKYCLYFLDLLRSMFLFWLIRKQNITQSIARNIADNIIVHKQIQ